LISACLPLAAANTFHISQLVNFSSLHQKSKLFLGENYEGL